MYPCRASIHRLLPIALAAVLLTGTATSAAAASDTELAASLDALFAEAYPADGPGAAVRIEKSGEVILRKGYGMADLELGVPIEPDMVFRLGSITKQFTATAVLLLAEEGKIDLDAPVAKYLTDYEGPAAKVTVAQLLNHTGGVPSYTALPEYEVEMREAQTPAEMLTRFRDLDLEFEPGSRWSYSNSGYFLLGLIVETVSDTSYEDFVETRIFEPLGMDRSRYGHEEELTPGRVEGYQGQPGAYAPAPYLSMTQPYSAGSLLSTVDDLARWDAALDAGEILTPEHRARLGEAITLPDGSSTGYSYGLFVGDYGGHRMILHGGGINGFSTHLLRVPDEDLFIAVLSNIPTTQPGPAALSFDALETLLGDPLAARPAVELSAKALDELTGVYAIGGPESEDVRVMTREGGELFSQRTGGKKSVVRFSGPDELYYPDSPTHARIVRGEHGEGAEVVGMWMIPAVGPEEYAVKTDRPIPAERQAIDLPSGLLDRYVGTYELFPGFSMAVSREGDHLSAQATGQPAFDLLPESETRFFIDGIDATIEFHGFEDGEADSITLYQGGREMPGPRVED